MKTIGITGGVGSGKSTVLNILKEICSCDIIQADEVARQLMSKGAKAYVEVLDFFGEEILASDREIDRKLLADIIFKSPNKRMVLNSIVHPLVKKEIINKINLHKINNDVDYTFVEAALLLEDHYEIFMDEVWYIYANEDARRIRLKNSRGYTDEKISDMIKSQLSEEKFRELTDHLIDNSYSEEETRLQLEKLI